MAPDKVIPSKKLEQILLNFIEVLRINILIVDSKGNPVVVPKTYGHGFYGASQWGGLQHLGTPEFPSKFHAEGNYLKFVDIFGFQSFAIPISIRELDDIGYLIVGPVVLNKPLEQSRYQAIAQDFNVNYSDFVECLNEVRVLSFNGLKSIMELLFELSRYSLRMEVTERTVMENFQTGFIHPIFTTALELSMALTQAECGSIMLLNKHTGELTIQAFKGIDFPGIQGISAKLDEGIAGLAAREKKAFVIREGQSNDKIHHLLKKPELNCALVLPIIKNNDEILGVMNISTHQKTSRLATHSQQMLKSLTEITSAAFSNI